MKRMNEFFFGGTPDLTAIIVFYVVPLIWVIVSLVAVFT